MKPFHLSDDNTARLNHEYEEAKSRFSGRNYILQIDENDEILNGFARGENPVADINKVYDLASRGYELAHPDTWVNAVETTEEDIQGGRTIPLSNSAVKHYCSLILLRKTFPTELADGVIVPPGVIAAAKLYIIYHELGHANHIKKGIGVETYNAAEVEPMADEYARRHLLQIKLADRPVMENQRISNVWQLLEIADAIPRRTFKEVTEQNK